MICPECGVDRPAPPALEGKRCNDCLAVHARDLFQRLGLSIKWEVRHTGWNRAPMALVKQALGRELFYKLYPHLRDDRASGP